MNIFPTIIFYSLLTMASVSVASEIAPHDEDKPNPRFICNAQPAQRLSAVTVTEVATVASKSGKVYVRKVTPSAEMDLTKMVWAENRKMSRAAESFYKTGSKSR